MLTRPSQHLSYRKEIFQFQALPPNYPFERQFTSIKIGTPLILQAIRKRCAEQ